MWPAKIFGKQAPYEETIEHVKVGAKILGLFSLYEVEDKLWDFWSRDIDTAGW